MVTAGSLSATAGGRKMRAKPKMKPMKAKKVMPAGNDMAPMKGMPFMPKKKGAKRGR